MRQTLKLKGNRGAELLALSIRNFAPSEDPEKVELVLAITGESASYRDET